ncbi:MULTISPECIES: hypothetical protein [unclassified Nonomuraea]|uniref:hypothetical protein n=1 Tax=unclassified Nonomuraea TaxID=2593643 RepID=UPI0033D342BF
MPTPNTASPQQGASKVWLQTGPLTFAHGLRGANRVHEKVSEVPDLQIPFPGVWEVSYHALHALAMVAPHLYIQTALFINGVLLPGSEALSGLAGATATLRATAGQTLLQTFAAGDVVTLHAYRNGTGDAVIESSGDGRTGVMAHWVSAV